MVIVSERVPPSARPWLNHLRTKLVQDALELTAALAQPLRRADVVVLDTSVYNQAGRFDAADALHTLWNERDFGGAQPRILFFGDGSSSSAHVNEELLQLMARWGMTSSYAGAVCHRGECLDQSIRELRRSLSWRCNHIEWSTGISVLYSELQQKTLFPSFFTLVASGTTDWKKMAERLGRPDPNNLRKRLQPVVRPALERLGWIDGYASVTLASFAAKASWRRDYVRRFVGRYRPDLRPLLLT